MARTRTVDDDVLLEAAMRLFWERGYASTGIRDLEAALGMKAPGIYHRFGAKDALFQSVLTFYLDKIIGWRVTHYLEAENPLAGLLQFFTSTFSRTRARQSSLSCLLVNTMLEMVGKDTEIRRIIKQGNQRIVTGLRATLARLIAHGQMEKDADIDDLAEHLLLCLQGLLVSTRLETDKLKLQRKVTAIFAALPLTPAGKELIHANTAHT